MGTEALRVVQISDPHFGTPHQENWELALEWLAAERPEIVIVTGDVAFNNPDSEIERDLARRELARIPVPWKVIPGNHDLGDSMINPQPTARITSQRRDMWRTAFGSEWWIERVGGWALLGVNAQLVASEDDGQQFSFIERALADVPTTMPLALFTHKALFADHPSESTLSTDVLDPAARSALLSRLRGHSLRLVASGHNHQYRSFTLDGTVHVWAPSVACVNKSPDIKRWGERRVGFIDYRLGPEGRVRLRVVGSDFLVRNESYMRTLGRADREAMASREHPVRRL